MDIKEKLRRLRDIDDVALIRWTGGNRICDGKFIPATELRLSVLACSGGRVFFSMAGSVMLNENGNSRLRFFDQDLFRIATGPRKNVNVFGTWIKDDEEAVPLTQCMHVEVTDDCTKFVAKRVLEMGTSPYYPAFTLPVPDFYRMTEKPDNFRPLYSRPLLAAIGATQNDNVQTLKRKFIKNLERIGSQTSSGWIVRDELIAMGGMCVCPSDGITKSQGSRVFSMPLKLLQLDLMVRHWNLHLGDEHELDRIFEGIGEDAKDRTVDHGDDRPGSNEGR